MAEETNLKARRRSEYPYFLSYRTRWSVHRRPCSEAAATNQLRRFVNRSDNDQYAHVNNSIYYHLFDSVVNTYLIEHCGLSPTHSKQIGLVVSSWCNFFSPVSFPVVLDLGLRVSKLGSTSVAYEVAVFEEGHDVPSAVGGYTHVFVHSVSRKSAPMDQRVRSGLSELCSSRVGPAKL